MVRVKDIPNYSKDLPFIEGILSGIGKYITWVLIHTPITGTQVTLISILFALAGAALSALGYFKLGFLMFFIFIILDHVDGQVARFKGQSGPHGVYLDSRTHFIVEPLYFIGLGIGASYISWATNESIYLSLIYCVSGILAALFYLMRQTMKIGDLGTAPIRSMKAEPSFFGKANYIIFDFIRINNPVSLMAIAIFFGYTGEALCIYATLFGLNVIYSFYKTWKNLKES